MAEVMAARERLFASHDYDLQKLVEHLRHQEKMHGRTPVTYPKRTPTSKRA